MAAHKYRQHSFTSFSLAAHDEAAAFATTNYAAIYDAGEANIDMLTAA